MTYSLLVGLGNPGRNYQFTRHNLGFLLADALVDGSNAKWQESQGALVSELHLELSGQRHKLWVIKPQGFMNLSGVAVRNFVHYHKIPVEGLIVAHDDLGLELGMVKVIAKRGEGGHNGLRSLSAELGSKAYTRVRLGIGRPPHPDFEISNWVLGQIPKEDVAVVDSMLKKGKEVVAYLLEKGLQQTQNFYN